MTHNHPPKILRAERLAREYADQDPQHWGLRYDAFRAGLNAVTGLDGLITDEVKDEVERMLLVNKNTPMYISKSLGIDVKAVNKIYYQMFPNKARTFRGDYIV